MFMSVRISLYWVYTVQACFKALAEHLTYWGWYKGTRKAKLCLFFLQTQFPAPCLGTTSPLPTKQKPNPNLSKFSEVPMDSPTAQEFR